MSVVRSLENRFFRSVRDRRSVEAEEAEPGAWNLAALADHKYCLLTSFRRSGAPVHTPVWFGTDSERIYVRSGASDGKVKRIRRESRVLVSPCSARGKPLGAPMQGFARILEPHEYPRAEAALRRHYGLGRKLYRLLRRRIEVAYLEVEPGAG